jgi:hypothetical protein
MPSVPAPTPVGFYGKKSFLLVQLLFLSLAAFSQRPIPAFLSDSLSRQAYRIFQNEKEKTSLYPSEGRAEPGSPAALLDWKGARKTMRCPKPGSGSPKNSDTLFIGLTPGDSLYITGAWSHPGPVFVLADGKLVIENADVSLGGDLIAWGEEARVDILSSTIRMPQAFIYQRGMIAAGQALIHIEGSLLDYSGLSHNLVITDSARVEWKNVSKIGFTTCGLWGRGSIEVEDCPETGEFILTGKASATFRQANTILLWHNVPDALGLDLSFPEGDSIAGFEFSPSLPGVNGLDYSYQLDSCTDVMWGLMPEPGSTVHISDTELRTIGLWFRDPFPVEVSGLVNSSQYSLFSAPLADRSLILENCFVRTWSLYLFGQSAGTINNAIIGEIGCMDTSQVTINNCLVDGSGGYLFVEGSSIATFGFSYLSCDFQSKDQSVAILAYGGQTFGRCIAMDQSIMVVLQSNLPAEPEIFGDAMVWYGKIEGPAVYYADQENTITGSAWIEKGSDYFPNSFGQFQVFYRQADSTEWIAMGDEVAEEKHSGILATWNTAGLSPGAYLFRMLFSEDAAEPISFEVLRPVSLLPANGIHYADPISIPIVFPNPTKGPLTIGKGPGQRYWKLYDAFGNFHNLRATGDQLDISEFPPGLYVLEYQSLLEGIRQEKVVRCD